MRRHAVGRRSGLLGHLDHEIAVREGVQVRPADAAGQGAHQHLAGPGLRVGDVVDHERARRA